MVAPYVENGSLTIYTEATLKECLTEGDEIKGVGGWMGVYISKATLIIITMKVLSEDIVLKRRHRHEKEPDM